MNRNIELEFQKVLLAENFGSFVWKNACTSLSLLLLVSFPAAASSTTAFRERCEFCHTCSEQVRICNEVTPQSHLLLLVYSCLHTSVFLSLMLYLLKMTGRDYL
jgi:hypothetical protein